MDENSVLDPPESISRNAYKSGTGTTINCLVICGYLSLLNCPKAKNSDSQLSLSMANLNWKISHFLRTLMRFDALLIYLFKIFYTCSFIIFWIFMRSVNQGINQSGNFRFISDSLWNLLPNSDWNKIVRRRYRCKIKPEKYDIKKRNLVLHFFFWTILLFFQWNVGC